MKMGDSIGEQAAVTRNIRLDLPLTRETMSKCLGLALGTVSRQIGQLGREGVIAPGEKCRVLIPDIARLELETGDDLVAA